MEQINLQQAEFRNESELKSYLVSLVLGYASTMNRIETEIFLKQEAGGISTSDLFEEYEQKYLPVFTAYCSDKKRVYGGAGSFGCPTKFDGIEKCIEANVVFKNSNRAEVYFKTENDFDAKYLFVLVRKKGLWRIDNAKERWFNGSWRNIIL
jgi:hypothetical protein